MARGPICTFCDEKLQSGSPFCAKCGHPTQWATHDDRVLWELGQWETSRRSDNVQREQGARASSSVNRTQALADNVRERAQTSPAAQPETNGDAQSGKRSLMSRFRKVAPPDAVPSPAPTSPAPRRVDPPVQRPAPQARPAAQARPAPPARPAPQRQVASGSHAAPQHPPARPAAAPMKPAAKAAPASPPARSAPVPTPQRIVVTRSTAAAKTPSAPAAKASPAPVAKAQAAPAITTNGSAAAATAPVIEPEAKPAKKPDADQTPLVLVRRAVGNRPPATAQPAQAQSRPAPSAPARPEPKPRAAAPTAPPKPAPQTRPAPKAQPKPVVDEKKRRKDAAKREKKHRRHSKRVGKRAVSLDLKDGERVSLSIEGWSRFRRATLVVTNYRVALITRVPPVVRWIPLEEVGTISHKWLGAHSLVIAAPAEVITLQKRGKDMLASFQQLLESEVQESRAHGSSRHHGDITQEWMEHASQVWDSHQQRLRLWVRRHPIVAFVGFVSCVGGAFAFTTWLTSVFNSVG